MREQSVPHIADERLISVIVEICIRIRKQRVQKSDSCNHRGGYPDISAYVFNAAEQLDRLRKYSRNGLVAQDAVYRKAYDQRNYGNA